MATGCRHTFSGTVVAAALVAATTAIGWVPAATAEEATGTGPVAPQACPQTWPALHAGPPAGAFDGNVSVLVGGSLRVAGAAAGAEGTVVALGDATFARDEPGAYELGVSTLGSQVSPFPGADMLVVGGNLSTAPGTHVDVGQGIGGDVVVGGTADGVDLDPHGGRVDPGVAGATAPYADLAGQLAGKSAAYAALPPTGTVDLRGHSVTLTGDGVSNPQVFTVDGASLGEQEGPGTSLQLLGVPQDAAVVVNLTGPAVDLDVDALLSPDGAPVDPLTDPYFAGLATHLLWNAPSATTVDVGGLAQLPGSLLVPTAPSTTTLAGAGTNGRVLVGGDLVQTGASELHAYPFLADPQLACGPDPVHLTTLTLDVELVDPDRVVDRDRFFEGTFDCTLDGVDVTPADNTWKLRAGATDRVLSDQVPAGASCTVTERLDAPPAPFRSWANPAVQPDVVLTEKRLVRGFTVTNRVKDLPAAVITPGQEQSPTPTPTPAATPTQIPSEDPTPPPPPPVPSTTPTAAPSTPSSVVEPTNRPELPASPSAVPTTAPTSAPSPTDAVPAPQADAPRAQGPAGPLATTAPFTLRGAFVWGPMLMLSLLTLLLRVRRRPKRLH